MTSATTPALSGVIPPVCTPLTADRAIDVDSVGRLADYLVAAGVNGLFYLGSSSEVAFLTDAERGLVLRTAIARVAGRVPVLAGAIDMTTSRVIEHARAAIDAGAAGIVSTGPFYTRTHVAEVEVHFREIKKAIGATPLFAYDVPVSAGGLKLDRDMVLRLAEEGVLAGVKDSSGDDAGLRMMILGKRERGLDSFAVLTGSELTVDSALWMGADGVVPGLGNVDPDGYVALYRHARAGEWEKAREVQERLCRLFPLVDVAPASRMGRGSSALGAFKAGIFLRGVISSPITALPAIPLNDAEIAAVRTYLVRDGLV